MKNRSGFSMNLLLVLAVIVLALSPLAIKQGSEFGGADAEAQKVAAEVSPGYEPWYRSFWEPPGTETESLLFALQAAAGSGFIGYYFGYQRGRKKEREKN